MPGQYALRGGILDVYSPEAERPVRIEFFGDEVESIRRFDPASQRSSNPMDEALLLPLTETPVSEELLGAIHARLSGKRITGIEEIVEAAVRSGGVTVFPGWEFYAPVAGAERTDLRTACRALPCLLDEPEALQQEFDRFWAPRGRSSRAQRRGQSGAPEDLYLPPDELVGERSIAPRRGSRASGHLPSADGGRIRRFLTQPTPRFHGAVPAMLEEVQKLTGGGESGPVRRAQHRRSRATR